MIHGTKAANDAEQAAKEAFSGNFLGSTLPSLKISNKDLAKSLSIIDLVILSRLENSKSEVRRLIKGNAIKLNNNVISNENFRIKKNLFINKYLKLSIGKKRHLKVEID